MPRDHPTLDIEAVRRSVRHDCWREDGDDLLGLELEWLTIHPNRRSKPVDLEALEAIVRDVGTLPNRSQVTIEPGGQLELATQPMAGASSACVAAGIDLALLHHGALRAGIDLIALGIDPARPPERVVTAPRYSAMQRHFDRASAAGRTMMCSTASLQLNIGLGPSDQAVQRWRLAAAIGPTLLATFANSPVIGTGPTGSKSTRSAYWWGIDATRTAPVSTVDHPIEAWIDYALSASIMLMRLDDDDYVAIPERLSFGDWVRHGHELGWPTVDDLRYHLTTLFPPLRLRGWIELRMIDALPAPTWQVAAHVVDSLLREPAAAADVFDAVRDTEDRWVAGARHGLDDPQLARASARLFDLAIEIMQTQDVETAFVNAVIDHRDRYVRDGRTPADDVLDAYANGISGARIFDLRPASIGG